MKKIQVRKDLVIVGAGIPGIVHAIQAARMGVTVALVHNRGYLGGNSSAETVDRRESSQKKHQKDLKSPPGNW